MSASFDALVPPLPPAPALPDPPIAVPADPNAKPVNSCGHRACSAGVQCSQAAGARQHRVHTRAHADARQRCHAGHPRDAGAHAVISGSARGRTRTSVYCIAMPTSWPSRKPRWPRPPNARPGMRRPGPNTESRCARRASSPRHARPTNSAIKANPSYAPAHRNLGVLLDLYLEDPLTAQTEFETYKTLTGEDKPVSGWLAELRARNKVRAPASEAAPEPTPEAAPEPAPHLNDPRPSLKEAQREQTTIPGSAVVSWRRAGADACPAPASRRRMRWSLA